MKVNKLKLDTSGLAHLLEIADPPKTLFYAGDVSLLDSSPKIAVVGSRKVSSYGRAVTNRLVQHLAKHGVIIISGLALGVDSIAHMATLEAGGKTIAVLPSGIERIYPASHSSLARRILDNGGLLISEYTGIEPPMRHQFIARNRIISGLSDAVVIPEAGLKSGSLHTANFALEQGRTVFAVPGNISSPNSQGTNNLIKTGAITVTEPDDIYTALGYTPQSHRDVIADNKQEALILVLLKDGIRNGSELQAASKLSASSYSQTMTMLEISGRIRSLGADQWSVA